MLGVYGLKLKLGELSPAQLQEVARKTKFDIAWLRGIIDGRFIPNKQQILMIERHL